MSKRYEFGQRVRREGLRRSGMECEAVGERYGLPPGKRCAANLYLKKINFDHWPLPAYQKGSDTLENCVVCCEACNQFANNKFDTPRAAKEKRVSDAHLGIKRVKQKIPSRGFQQFPSNTKQLREDYPS